MEVAAQINKLNAMFNENGKKYVLIGPGRWGSSDRWLGIPVVWNDISNVGVMVETTIESIKADPSQGSHFFHNITTLGINYFMVLDKPGNRMNWEWFTNQHIIEKGEYVSHLRLPAPVILKVDGRSSQWVILPSRGSEDYCLLRECVAGYFFVWSFL